MQVRQDRTIDTWEPPVARLWHGRETSKGSARRLATRRGVGIRLGIRAGCLPATPT